MRRKRLTKAVLDALELLPLEDIARGIGRASSTLWAYRNGRLIPTPETARRIASFFRRRSNQLSKAAEKLEAAADEEES